MTDEKKPLPDASKGWGMQTFALRHPFIFAGMEYRELQVRVPTGLDIRAYVEEPNRGYEFLARRLLDLDVKILEAMHGTDYSRLMSRMGEFFGRVIGRDGLVEALDDIGLAFPYPRGEVEAMPVPDILRLRARAKAHLFRLYGLR